MSLAQQLLELVPEINRIVLMGIAEPLHNYGQILAAIRILATPKAPTSTPPAASSGAC